jgi:SAM-dependent methyltransferase
MSDGNRPDRTEDAMKLDHGVIAIRDERGFNQVYVPRGSTVRRAWRRNQWFVEQARSVAARRILEIGSGLGTTAAHVANNIEADVLAIDLSQAFVDAAKQSHARENLAYRVANLATDDLEEFGLFDLIYGIGILHHLTPTLPDFLRRLHGLLSPNGLIAFIEPNLLNPFCLVQFGTKLGRRLGRLEPDEMAFTRGKLQRLLAAGGWKNIEVQSRDFLLPSLPEWTVDPIITVEPLFEATPVTWWLAQSHFIRAQA